LCNQQKVLGHLETELAKQNYMNIQNNPVITLALYSEGSTQKIKQQEAIKSSI